MDLLPFFQWCYLSPVGEGIRNSTWLFPVFEAMHLLGFGLTLGAALTVDLRLLGVGLSKQPVGQLYRAVQPWMIGSVTLMFATGIPIFMSESIKCFYSGAFWVKMSCLFLVIVFTFTILRAGTQKGFASARFGKLAAIVSLVLWAGVAWGGRWIGFGG
jgi:uncharacterized membrane protein SirB2